VKTRDISVARVRRWKVLADIKNQIEAAKRGVQGDWVTQEGLESRDALAEETRRMDKLAGRVDWDDPDDIDAFESNRTDEFLRDDIRERAIAMDRQQPGTGQVFFDIATGKLTPLGTYVEDWLREGGIKGSLTERTKVEHRRAVRELVEWLGRERLPPSLDAITRRIAGRFVSDHLLRSGRQPRTISKTVSTLSSYWKWLRRRGHIHDDGRNPWSEQAPSNAAVAAQNSEPERPFTDAELVRLLASPPDTTLTDFMRMGALTGMRREEMGRLTVADCAGGIFIVQRGKTTAARRRVPIHSDLAQLVARRTRGKKLDTYLFDELQSKNAERTDPIGKAFMRYRRSLGIQDGDGRRSRVNFHSFRRWFNTAAINAGQPPHIVALVMGHSEGRKGMTLGLYWAGAEDKALRSCVNAVQLPSAAEGNNANKATRKRDRKRK
jgi:integrase